MAHAETVHCWQSRVMRLGCCAGLLPQTIDSTSLLDCTAASVEPLPPARGPTMLLDAAWMVENVHLAYEYRDCLERGDVFGLRHATTPPSLL